MAVYTFVNGQRKTVFTYNPRVVVGGIVRKIIEGYTFINGIRYRLFNKWSFDHTQVYTQDSVEELPLGTYKFIVRGAGGAGGETPPTASGWNFVAGVGGCGGKGELKEYIVDIPYLNIAQIRIGEGGKIYSSGGNGGEYGNAGSNGAPRSGSGGGGGKPSYLQLNLNYYIANGGGGGGGGGGIATANRRYDNGGAGGGGGGFYKTEIVNDVLQIISVAGKKGRGATDYDTPGVAGATGDGDPELYGGAGGKGGYNHNIGGAQGFGGGASGASGGGGPSNDNGSAGGSGGGGAGGCKDAGGGKNARNTIYNNFNSDIESYNAGKTTPTNTLPENAEYGVNANYGIGGTTNTNGAQGFILIQRLPQTPTPVPFEKLNMGYIVESVKSTINCGNIIDNVDDMINCGNIM